MKKLTEEQLVELGFKKAEVSAEESGEDIGYYYYTYELGNGECLLTNTNDDEDRYFVEFLSIPDLGKFRDVENLKNLIDCLSKAEKD